MSSFSRACLHNFGSVHRVNIPFLIQEAAMIKNDFNYLRTSCCSLSLGKANVTRNVEEILKAVKAAVENGVSLLVLPPMAITSPFCGNLFFQNHLYNMQYAGIKSIITMKNPVEST